MHWEYDGTGTWEASSAKKHYGRSYIWRIYVCDDGTFSVADSDKTLTKRKENFDTFKEAKTHCEVIEENQMVNDDVI